MKKVIKISLDPKSIREAAFEVRKYHDDMKLKLQQAIALLGDEAAERCRAAYAVSDKTVNVTCIHRPDGLGFTILAEGKAVSFLEFGAGTATDAIREYASDAPFPVYPGSYSEQNARQYYENGYWYFGGQKFYYIEPRRGLYEASKFIRENGEKIIKGILSQ